MSHPNLAMLPGRDPACTFPVRTVFARCSDYPQFPCNIGDEAHCVIQIHYEDRDGTGEQWAWHVHAHESTHMSCRLSDATPVAQDETGGPDVEWTPTCVDCHEHFGCPDDPHHATGLKRRSDGHLLIHRNHPRFDEIAGQAHVIVHSGKNYTDCERCAPRALACDGCRSALEG